MPALCRRRDHLERGLDVVTSWGRKWRFIFSVSPEKSVVMIFGPSRRTLFFCSVTLCNLELPVVRVDRCLGVNLTPSLSYSQRRSLCLFRFLDEHLRAPERNIRIGVCG